MISPTALMAVVYWFSPVVGSRKWRDLGSLGSPFEAVKSMAMEKFMEVPPCSNQRPMLSTRAQKTFGH
jgi:hypothetical protein